MIIKSQKAFRENLLAVAARTRKAQNPDATIVEKLWEQLGERHAPEDWAAAFAEQARLKAEHSILVARLAGRMRENQKRIK